MTYLWDVLDPWHLQQMVDEGYVRVQTHPSLPYKIACYTKKTMFDREWNDTTKVCRGLIWNAKGDILARPFAKFFNMGEPNAPVFSDDDWVTVFDKLDGSLGIAYETPDGPAIATKGSFASEQAIKATELLRTKYRLYQHDDIHTDLFEIIYPENRIVLDYGDTEELKYIGSVDIADGTDYWNGLLMAHYNIPRNHCTASGEWGEIRQSINLERPNSEGFVVLREETGDRIKLKQPDYLELHKVMTGLNERQLWEWLSEPRYISDILKDLPEELHDWAKPVMESLVDRFLRKKGEVMKAYMKTMHMGRKEFALSHSHRDPVLKGALFAQYDKNVDRADAIIWKAVRP